MYYNTLMCKNKLQLFALSLNGFIYIKYKQHQHH